MRGGGGSAHHEELRRGVEVEDRKVEARIEVGEALRQEAKARRAAAVACLEVGVVASRGPSMCTTMRLEGRREGAIWSNFEFSLSNSLKNDILMPLMFSVL